MTGLLSSFSVLSPFLSSFQSTPRCQGSFAVLEINSLYSSAQAGARRNSKYQSLYEHAALFRGYINCKSKNKDVVVGGVYYTQGELEINACKSYQKLEIFYHETNDNDIKQIIKEAGFDFAQQT